MNLFFTILYQPLFNLLVWLYDVLPGNDIGFAIIVVTLIIRFALFPLSQKSLQSQKAMQELQPKIQALKEQHKDNKEVLSKELMQLYAREKVNPLSSCLPLIVQLVVLIALYQVFTAGLNSSSLDALYSFVTNPGHIDSFFLNKIDLASPNIYLAILAGIIQFVQAKMTVTNRPPKSVQGSSGSKDEEMMVAMNRSMLYIMPVMTVFIGAKLPGGLALYWFVSNVFMVVQQMIVFRKKKIVPETIIEAKSS